MTRTHHLLLSALVAACALGCQGPDGQRVSMGQWWDARFNDKDAGGADARTDAGTQAEDPLVADEPRSGSGSNTKPLNDSQGAPKPTLTSAARPAPEREPSRAAITSDVLVLNDQTVDVMDVLDPIRGILSEAAKTRSPADYRKFRDDIVRRQIVEAVAERLIWQEARNAVSDDVKPQLERIVVAMEKDRINREFGGLETNYEKYLTRNGRTRADVRKMLERGVMIDKYLKDRLFPLIASPTRNELKKYYDQHVADFTSQSRRELFLIDIPIAAFLESRRVVTDAQIAAATVKARAQADEAARAIAAGKPFEDVARQYSKGLHKEKGGGWGFINEPLQGRWETPSKRLFTLNQGQVSEIIEAEKAFFIVKAGVVEYARTTPFTEAQPEIMKKIRQERFVKLRGDFLQKRFAKSQVGSLDNFYRRVLSACPPPGGGEGAGAPVRAGLSSSR